MENKVQMEGAVLWVDSNIIHCLIQKDFDNQNLAGSSTEIFLKKIKVLSNGKYLPLLIDLKEVDNCRALQLFQFFSPCSPLDLSVLSRSFLVRSIFLKMVFSLFCVATGNAFWDSVYNNDSKAIRYCNEKFKMFNVAC